tara:strand:+ start:265 stop:639 length:375 start_codon:yes stop_codon:yes gene_type:complete
MSSNRLMYDKCAYSKTVEQSTGPLEYQMFKGKFENCKQCKAGDHKNILDFGVRTDVESELRNQTRKSTTCPTLKYNPKTKSKAVPFTPPEVCDTIHYLTPNNIEKPTGPGFDDKKLAADCCPRK